MVYYSDGEVLIRSMGEADPAVICKEEIAQGWSDATEDKYFMRLSDSDSGKAIALTAEYRGSVAGYINVYIGARTNEETGQSCCEIVDFGVLEKYRRRGIGKRLMDTAEAIAFSYADTVYIGVGLHSGYGSAQRMYVKRGYIPDGRGVWYGGAPCEPYSNYCNDDDLNLRMSKKRP